MKTAFINKGKVRLSTINLFFTCMIVIWMVTPYLFRNISPILLISVFVGWLISFLPSMRLSRGYGLLAPAIWFLYTLLYRFLGLSSASWGNYIVQFFFWLNFFIGYACYKNYDKENKKFLIRFIWIVSILNIVDNIGLLVRYPDASTSLYQTWGTQYLSMNVGDTSFSYFTVFFFCFNCAYLFLYKRHKSLACFGVIVSLIYIYLSARTTTYLMLGMIIMCWAVTKFSNMTSRNNRRMMFLFSVLISLAVVFLVYPFIVEILVTLDTDSNVIKRLVEISNIVYGTNYSTVDSGTVRLTNTFLSLKTWLASVENFIFGIGFDGKSATTATVQAYGIGQHSETFDTFARYGIIGGILYLTALVSAIRCSLHRIRNKDFYKWIYISLVIYSVMNSFMNSSLLGLFLFVVYPTCDEMKCKGE